MDRAGAAMEFEEAEEHRRRLSFRRSFLEVRMRGIMELVDGSQRRVVKRGIRRSGTPGLSEATLSVLTS